MVLAIFHCRSIENCLKYKYQSVWNLMLGVLETFYTIAGKQCSNLMTKVTSLDFYLHFVIDISMEIRILILYCVSSSLYSH